MKKTTRRRFIGRTGSLLATPLLLPLLPRRGFCWPEPKTARKISKEARKNTLLVVFLRGGADVLNIVVPYTNKHYYAMRKSIAIPPPGKQEKGSVIKLDKRYGLHPALAPLKPLYDRGLLAPVLGTGSPHPTRSHFDAQDFMEYAAPGDRTVRDGWLNRYLAQSEASTQKRNPDRIRALAIQGLLPRSLRGHVDVLAVPRLTRQRSEGLLDLFDDVYGDEQPAMGSRQGPTAGRTRGREAVIEAGRSTIEVLRRFWDITDKSAGPREGVHYPKGSFAKRLMTLAQVIRARVGLEVAALDLTSWDHHQGEGSTDGAINRRLSILAQGLAAFAQDLGDDFKHVTVLVMSEFGRTAAENGNRGTDHGHGSLMLALGGPVAGGRVLGTYGTLNMKDLNEGRDLNVAIDFRQVFADVLEGLFAFKAKKGFFPRFRPDRPTGLMRKS